LLPIPGLNDNVELTEDIVQQVLVPLSTGVMESPTGIQLRIAELLGRPLPPVHYLDMELGEEPNEITICGICEHQVDSPTRNGSCSSDHYFCFACLNNHCIQSSTCPTCGKPFLPVFFRGDDKSLGETRFRWVEPPRDFLPEGDVEVVVNVLIRFRSKVIVFSKAQQLLDKLHERLDMLQMTHSMVTNPYSYTNVHILLMHQDILPFFKRDPTIRHIVGVRFDSKDKSFKYEFDKADVRLLV
jgi:hypothetical protein